MRHLALFYTCDDSFRSEFAQEGNGRYRCLKLASLLGNLPVERSRLLDNLGRIRREIGPIAPELSDAQAHHMTRGDELRASGLVGYGGAGFPTAVKWEAVAREPAPRYVIVIDVAGERRMVEGGAVTYER